MPCRKLLRKGDYKKMATRNEVNKRILNNFTKELNEQLLEIMNQEIETYFQCLNPTETTDYSLQKVIMK